MVREDQQLLWRTEKASDGSLRWRTVAPYSVDAALKTLQPEKRAHAFAVSEESEVGGDTLTLQEQDMLGELRSHVEVLREFFARAAGAIKKEIHQEATVPPLASTLDAIRAKFSHEANERTTDFDTEQHRNLRDRWQAYKQLNSFRVHNHLQERGAHYPDSRLLHLAIVFVALVGEGVANASFFPQDAGLIGGFFMAVMVSAANVGVSFCAGRFILPLLNHVRPTIRRLGLSSLGLVVLVLGTLHLVVAHYRETVARSQGAEAVWGTLTRLWQHPLGLEDMQSVLLILIGWTITAVAMWDGYSFDDPYPGYGRIYRLWKKLDDQVYEEVRSYKQSLNAILNTAVHELLQVPATIGGAASRLEGIQADVGAYFACCESYYDQAVNAGIRLVSSFRKVVGQVLGDASRFPVRENLVEGNIGELDPRGEEGAIAKLAREKRQAIAVALEAYKESKETFQRQLQEDYQGYIDRCAVDTLENAQPVREVMMGASEELQHEGQDVATP